MFRKVVGKLSVALALYELVVPLPGVQHPSRLRVCPNHAFAWGGILSRRPRDQQPVAWGKSHALHVGINTKKAQSIGLTNA